MTSALPRQGRSWTLLGFVGLLAVVVVVIVVVSPFVVAHFNRFTMRHTSRLLCKSLWLTKSKGDQAS